VLKERRVIAGTRGISAGVYKAARSTRSAAEAAEESGTVSLGSVERVGSDSRLERQSLAEVIDTDRRAVVSVRCSSETWVCSLCGGSGAESSHGGGYLDAFVGVVGACRQTWAQKSRVVAQQVADDWIRGPLPCLDRCHGQSADRPANSSRSCGGAAAGVSRASRDVWS
jgi:hypothetical protein